MVAVAARPGEIRLPLGLEATERKAEPVPRRERLSAEAQADLGVQAVLLPSVAVPA